MSLENLSKRLESNYWFFLGRPSLDEPGWIHSDSFRFFESGMTVICTIHQPSSELFTTFTHIMLLSQGYQPFIGTTKESIDFFESIGRPVPMYYNPADHFLEVLDECKRFEQYVTATLQLNSLVTTFFYFSGLIQTPQLSLELIIKRFESTRRPDSLKPRLKVIDEIDLIEQANWSSQDSF